ncbi:SEL1-like repeat protein [Helicobacter sp. MIT 05-5293]|uniref:SEL1-like repeat protein n=1 Tax=Helicobacter sp. MIT 05-5293 TaxID=1548149 RepID=UPI00051DB5C4|nr:SEL1-like repeat protein [Helicobacter sp. MIT 05-5293]
MLQKALYICFAFLVQVSIAQDQTPFHLNSHDISQVASLAEADLMVSPFVLGTKGQKKVLAISDFNDVSDFGIDIHLLARELVAGMLDSQSFTLTAAIAGNAFNADPSLDKIRSLRNNEEFSDIIPKGKLITPRYSLSARISNDIVMQNNLNIVTYHFIFSIVNLETGLVEWDYIEHIKKSSKEKLPSLDRESPYGRNCKANALNPKEVKQACEIAISEIWLGAFEEIPQGKRELLHTYAKRACELDSAFGCRALGTSYKFAHTDFAHAKKYYQKSCELKDGGGCYNLSILYEHAQGVNQNIPSAKQYANLACEYGYKSGCENLKLLEQYSDEDHFDERTLMLKSDCDMGLGIACGDLSFYYYHGMGGVNKNHTQARLLLEKGCQLKDVNSCYQLGLWEMQGLGGTLKDAKKALEHIKLACESDAKTNCKALQKMDSQKQDLYKCESNTPIFASSACHTTGGIYEHGFDTLKSDMNQALKYYKKACDAGLNTACSSYNNVQQKIK